MLARPSPPCRAILLGHGRCLAVLLIAIFAAPHAAFAVSYLSQSGTLDVRGGTAGLPSAISIVPVSGLGNLDVNANVQDGTAGGPEFFEAQVAVQTLLDPNQIHAAAQAFGTVTSICLNNSTNPCFAFAAADIAIAFALAATAAATLSQELISDLRGRPTDPAFELMLIDLSDSSVVLSTALDLLSASLQAGNYELRMSIFAFQPTGSCDVGCLSAAGAGTLTIVPEPGTAPLVALGMALIAHRVRQDRQAARSASLSGSG